MTTTQPSYVPLGLDLVPEQTGMPESFGIHPGHPPGPGRGRVSRLQVCGLVVYNAPGEVELLDVSVGDYHFLSTRIDAAAYNVEIDPPETPELAPDPETEDGGADPASEDRKLRHAQPRFCLFHAGVISERRPLVLTIRSQTKPLRGTLYGLPVLDGEHFILGVERWSTDREFLRFVDLAFEVRPASATMELMYYGWLGRARSGI
jgi:hypothetical protein